MTGLPEAELAFYFAAQAQLEPALRPVFAERVADILGTYSRSANPDLATSIAPSARRWSGCGCRRRTLSNEPFRAGPATRRNSSKSPSRLPRRKAERPVRGLLGRRQMN